MCINIHRFALVYWRKESCSRAIFRESFVRIRGNIKLAELVNDCYIRRGNRERINVLQP